MRKSILILFLSTLNLAKAQDTINISWEEVSQKSLDENLKFQLANKEIEFAEAELLSTRTMYLPNITASYSFIHTNSPLNAFGTKLNQSRITMEDFNPDYLNNPKSISDFSLKLEVEQPILNMDAIYQKKAGIVKTQALKIKSERIKENLEFELKKAYMMLQLSYKMLETLEKSKRTTITNKQVVENYYINGLVQKSDVLYMDVRDSEIESQIQYAQSNVLNASDYLSLLLNENRENKIYKPIEDLEIEKLISFEEPILNENRKDFQVYEKSLETYDWMIKSSKSKFLPRLNAFGSYELHDNNIYEFDGNGYLFGLQLSWNIFDGLQSKSEQATYQAEINKTKVEIAQYTQESELELKKAYRQVLDADKKVDLLEKAWEHSKEAYRIQKNRYDQGLEKSSDILIAETLMSQKELEFHQAIFEYNIAIEYYQFLK